MIQISPETQLFIREHSSDDVRTLALQAKKYPDINMPTAITQIAGRQVAAEKIPSWREIEEIWYPKHLSLEQCSSEITARYKARLFQGDSLTDLTGGFGIDCSFLATGFKSATYVELEALLLSKANRVMIKLSPMLDLSLALKELKHTQEIHILSVNNECKELLILLRQTSPAEIAIHCVNLLTKGTQEEQHLVFTREQEQRSQCTYTDSLGNYLYEPNASLLKAGAFRSIAAAYPVRKLHPNSHLYTSDSFIENFPGRIFRIVNQCSFNKKEVKENLADLKKANVTVRNFPATVAELRKRLHLTEGGDTYLFASTLNNGQKVIIRCEKV